MRIFLNYAGVAPVNRAVREAVYRWADIGSRSDFSYDEIIHTAKGLYSRIVNGDEAGIFFTRNTTHGLATFILGYPWSAGDSVVISDCEFPANRLPWLGLRERGVEVRIHRTRDYKVDLDEFISLCDRTTKAVSISWVQYLSGQRVDIYRLGRFCREHGIMFVLDAIQGLGQLSMDVNAACVDWLSADGHKWLCGPEGIGIGWASERALAIVRPPVKGWMSVADPFNFAEFDQGFAPDARRYLDGSLNVAGIMGLNAAVGMLLNIGIDTIEGYLSRLSGHILDIIKARGWYSITPDNPSERAGIVTFKPDMPSAEYFEELRSRGVICSLRSGFIRFSPHFFNSMDDINIALR